MGRSKYLTPVYQALCDSGQVDTAVSWNNENKDFYHPVAETSVMAIINDAQPSKESVEEEFEFDFDGILDRIVGELGVVNDITHQAFTGPLGFLN